MGYWALVAEERGYSQTNFYYPGDVVPKTAVYRAYHGDADASNEVTLLRGALFPSCKQCGEALYFEFIRAIESRLSDLEFHVDLYELPHSES